MNEDTNNQNDILKDIPNSIILNMKRNNYLKAPIFDNVKKHELINTIEYKNFVTYKNEQKIEEEEELFEFVDEVEIIQENELCPGKKSKNKKSRNRRRKKKSKNFF
ncbi:hypothetical protein COBT_000706 [Conglomerata obtusa]